MSAAGDSPDLPADPQAGPAGDPGTSPAPDASDPNYRGPDAKEWQARHDKVAAEAKALRDAMSTEHIKLNTPEDLRNHLVLLDRLSSHPEFEKFAARALGTATDDGGVNGSGNGVDPDDDLDDPDTKRFSLLERSARESASTSRQALTELRMAQAEDAMTKRFGARWSERKEEMLVKVGDMARRGLIKDPSQINAKFLRDAYVQALDEEEFTKMCFEVAQQSEHAREGRELGMQTTPPDTTRASGAQPTKAKNWDDAVRMAQAQEAAAGRR